MAHYDCRNCGTTGGIDYGFCKKCTPDVVLKAKAEAEKAKKQAEKDFDKQMRDIKLHYVLSRSQEYANNYKRLYDEHNPDRIVK